MLPDSKISQLISLQIPGLTYVMWQFRITAPVYEVVHVFTDYTKRMIRGGQLNEAKKCFTIAAVLYRNGSNLLRNAIESVYLYGLSPLLDTAYENHPVKALLPATLQHIRIRDVQNGTHN
ncbi:hypothetical protein F0L74_02540 [Chitinophaga agrisoli]|uniref:DUF7674 domain-containing protein n=1 Tax=Chitinophaga agrisoli TaxID=2607653 RepID=A0A5B2W287_9BACT|nr:hypothetical protein [Chitinophaga agrisoli]KAA2244860.1 hypothetical protein F0L74_02540 [Chitinophaga agrisoli]